MTSILSVCAYFLMFVVNLLQGQLEYVVIIMAFFANQQIYYLTAQCTVSGIKQLLEKIFPNDTFACTF